MDIVGKTLKSKINGAFFVVTELFEESGKKYYTVLDMASGKHYAADKELFEEGILPSLEIAE